MALGLFRRVRQVQPGNHDVGYLMGMALEQAGRLDEAMLAYKSCTKGNYASVAGGHVKMLAKKLTRQN